MPSFVVILGKSSFSDCHSLESVTFETDSRLNKIEAFAFFWSGLRSITIHRQLLRQASSVFSRCILLESVMFEKDSQLERIEDFAFDMSGSAHVLFQKHAFSTAVIRGPIIA
jgi:hypothetical protein